MLRFAKMAGEAGHVQDFNAQARGPGTRAQPPPAYWYPHLALVVLARLLECVGNPVTVRERA